jgi:hypothetical protein
LRCAPATAPAASAPPKGIVSSEGIGIQADSAVLIIGNSLITQNIDLPVPK